MRVAKFEAQDFRGAASFPSKRLFASIFSETDILVVTDGKGWYWMTQGIVLKDIEGFEVEGDRLKRIRRGEGEVEVEVEDRSVYFLVAGAKIKVGETTSWSGVDMPKIPDKWYKLPLDLLKKVALLTYGGEGRRRIVIDGGLHVGDQLVFSSKDGAKGACAVSGCILWRLDDEVYREGKRGFHIRGD